MMFLFMGFNLMASISTVLIRLSVQEKKKESLPLDLQTQERMAFLSFFPSFLFLYLFIFLFLRFPCIILWTGGLFVAEGC